jgi:hypothetical protein
MSNQTETVFAEGSIEETFIKTTGVKRASLSLPHNMFKMRIDENGDLVFYDLGQDLQRVLYHQDITDTYEESISYLDFILSAHNESSFGLVANWSKSLDITDFDSDDYDDQLFLMSYFCQHFFSAKYKNVNTLDQIDRPIPIQLFCQIINKSQGLEVCYKDEEGNTFAGKLVNVKAYRSMFSSGIDVKVTIISRGKDGFTNGNAVYRMPYKTSATNLSDIGLTKLTPELKAQFTERGKKYVELNSKPSYVQYNGFGFKYGGWFGDNRITVNGRIMIDVAAMRTLNSRIDDDWYIGNVFANDTFPRVDESALWMCSPVVYGFSFLTKDWLRMSFDSVSNIQFSVSAFDELIVPQEYKDVFIACLTNDMPSLDSIEGKGSGKIFLLYGAPGVGKTMTAESVAEYLKRPLYYVSVGELGTTPAALEENLSQIMDVAISWDAIVLLDEVDVFAQDRTNADVERTAMTAILLRLLEKFSGILFMTTNLKQNLDAAFISRATATIPYEKLDSATRVKIWRNILGKASNLGVKVDKDVHSSLEVLAAHELNGREIKNQVRLAYSVAMSAEHKTITLKSLNTLIKMRTA